MTGMAYPYIEPLSQPPVYMHLSDINSIESFFIFMDAAIRCHPFVLISSFALTLFLFYIILNSKRIYNCILKSYSDYLYYNTEIQKYPRMVIKNEK
jgi:hypothetical protein